MNNNFMLGDLLKVDGQNRLIQVKGFTKNIFTIPDGWIIADQGEYINPNFCSLYNGAKSVLTTKD